MWRIMVVKGDDKMADDIKVKPTPIQRNILDVAMELTELFCNYHSYESLEDLQNAFVKFYAVAQTCEYAGIEKLLEYVPEEFKKVYKK